MKTIARITQKLKDALCRFFFVRQDEEDRTATLILDRKVIDKELRKHGIA